MVCAWLSLCFALLSPAAVLFSVALRSLRLGLSVSRFPGVGSFSPSQFPLRSASPVLIPFTRSFSFCSTQLCVGFLALFGGF